MGLWSMAKDTFYYGHLNITRFPRALRSVRQDPEKKHIIEQLGLILKSDMLPVMLVNGAFYLLHQQVEAWEQDNPQEGPMSSWNARDLLRWGMMSLQVGIVAFNIRMALKFQTHKIFFNANIGKMLAKSNPNYGLHTAICKNKECSFLRISQGLVRDTVAYLMTDFSMSGLQFFGVPSELIFIFRAMNEGRFVLSILVAGCNREQSLYAAQNPGLVLAIGLGYTVPLKLAELACQQTGLQNTIIYPLIVYPLLCELFLVLQLLMASGFNLPKPSREIEDALQWGDPVGFFQWCVGLLFDTFALGLKEKIDRSLKQPHNQGLAAFNEDSKLLWTLSAAKQLFWISHWICSPAILRDKRAIMSDAITGEYLAEVFHECIPVIKSIEDLVASHTMQALLQILVISPKKTSDCIRTFYNLPAPLIIGVLHLVKQGNFHERVFALREFLESFLPPQYIELPTLTHADALSKPMSSGEREAIEQISESLSSARHDPVNQAKMRTVAGGFFDHSAQPSPPRSRSPSEQQSRRLNAASFFDAYSEDTPGSVQPPAQDRARKLAAEFYT